jgi:hypothetical protein
VKSPILFSEFPYQLNRDANIEKKRTFGAKENAKSIWAGKKTCFAVKSPSPTNLQTAPGHARSEDLPL